MGRGNSNAQLRRRLRAACMAAGLLTSAAPATAAAQPLPSGASLLAQNKPLNVNRTYRHGDLMELHTAYVQQPAASGDRRGYLGLKMQSDLGASLPALQAELDYGAFDPAASLALDDGSHRSVWLGVHSTWHDLRYGFNYQSMGRDFVPLAPVNAVIAPGKNRAEVWAQQQLGRLGVRAYAWQAKDQPYADPAALRQVDRTIGTTLNYMLLPAAGLTTHFSYARQTTHLLDPAAGAAAIPSLTHNLFSSLSMRREHWSASLSTAYAYGGSDEPASPDPWVAWSEELAVSYTPLPNLSLSPRVRFQTASEAGCQTPTRTRSAAIALQMRPDDGPLLFTATSSLESRRNAAWSAAERQLNTQASVQMPLRIQQPQQGSLAVRVNYAEATNAYANSSELSVNLELSLHEFN